MSVQLTTLEGKQRKKFTARQRLEILREWDSTGNGVEVSLRYGIHPMTLYRWKKRLEQGAAEFLKGSRSLMMNTIVFSSKKWGLAYTAASTLPEESAVDSTP